MIEKKDFIEIDYTGKIQDTGEIFDTTIPKVAKENGIDADEPSSVIICVGEKQILPGLDDNLEGKEVGDEFTVGLEPEDAFGKKDPKKIQLVATTKFTKNDIKPFPGLRIEVDGQEGTIKNVSGGRTIVDFNHPLAGKNLEYDLTIKRKIEDDDEKIRGYFKLLTQQDLDLEIKDGEVIMDAQLSEEFFNTMSEELSRLLDKEITVRSKENLNTEEDEDNTDE